MPAVTPESYDLAVIGGGSGGYAAARTAVDEGLKTVVIDGAMELGGLCILRGCMPSKTLIESANRFLTIRRANEFGLAADKTAVDAKAIIERKRRLIGEFAEYRAGQLTEGKFDLIRGHACFTNPHTVDVTPIDGSPSQSVEARTFVIATGSTIFVPDVEGLAATGFLTSDDILDLAEVPDSVIVLGGGAIALEMAHYLEGIGKEITVIQRSGQLLTGMDEDIAHAAEKALGERMKIYCGTKLLSARRTEDGNKSVTFEYDGSEVTTHAGEILAALGRQPATKRLGLDAAGVDCEGLRIATGANMATSQDHIFAAGDACGPFEVVHVAIAQGEAAARNAAKILRGESESQEELDYRLKLYGIFTEPQVAVAGMSELDAREAGREIITATYPFNDHGKSMVMGETHGFVKLIADRATKEFLGGAVIGPEATELIHEVVVALHFRAKADDFMTIPHYHPTLSEVWTYPAEELAEM
jgi:pyruvate/2-oxoglutarate dehydrogenase complex dihydrolipoamide dehydrogenase (E3) component